MNPKELMKKLLETLPSMKQEHCNLGETILRQEGAIEACRVLCEPDMPEVEVEVRNDEEAVD